MELSKNFFLILSLSVSIIGLTLIYVASVNIEPEKITISDITSDMEGRKISTIGYLIEKREVSGGHLFLTLSDNKTTIQVPLFADMMKNLNNIGVTKNDFHIKQRIAIEGTIEIYKGTLQVIPNKPSDVKILGE